MSDLHDVHYESLRRRMVEQIASLVLGASESLGKTSLSERVMRAVGRVPRHLFVPEELTILAYVDAPLPIGFGKSISQPFMVALLADLLAVEPGQRVLEVGTGLGYQAAILAELGADVFTVEIIAELSAGAQRRLADLGYGGISYRIGDGARGWPEMAPFDRILVTAAPESFPASLMGQLGPGGRLIVPVGPPDRQTLLAAWHDAEGRVVTQDVLPVRFSRMVVAH
ncbi:MAG: protein-L-isoaspartate(D-aspartate) O-methyltransferase [Thalassobaculales bacterium]